MRSQAIFCLFCSWIDCWTRPCEKVSRNTWSIRRDASILFCDSILFSLHFLLFVAFFYYHRTSEIALEGGIKRRDIFYILDFYLWSLKRRFEGIHGFCLAWVIDFSVHCVLLRSWNMRDDDFRCSFMRHKHKTIPYKIY